MESEVISESTFAQGEAMLGRAVHFHDGVWWVRSAPFYYKPVHEFRSFPPSIARPERLKAILGYSHQVPDAAQATHSLQWHVLQGDDLQHFSIESLKPAKRRAIRRGLADCRVGPYELTKRNLEAMRQINISQARRFAGAGESGSFLPAEHYEEKASEWRERMTQLVRHRGHQLVGAFFGEELAAYIDLIRIEDTWMFGAVKSCDEFLPHRPVDAMYFTILSMASQDQSCSRVVNGGPVGERASLAYFKEQFLLNVVSLPYFTRSFLSYEKLRYLHARVLRRGGVHGRGQEEAEGKPCAASPES